MFNFLWAGAIRTEIALTHLAFTSETAGDDQSFSRAASPQHGASVAIRLLTTVAIFIAAAKSNSLMATKAPMFRAGANAA